MPLAAAKAESPIATRMPLMVRTAVHKLCAMATTRLAPPTALHLLESTLNLQSPACIARDRFNQLKVLEPSGQSNCR